MKKSKKTATLPPHLRDPQAVLRRGQALLQAQDMTEALERIAKYCKCTEKCDCSTRMAEMAKEALAMWRPACRCREDASEPSRECPIHRGA